MSSSAESFKAKLLADIIDFNFQDWSEENARLSKLVYDAVNSVFDNHHVESVSAVSVSPQGQTYLFGAGDYKIAPVAEVTKVKRKENINSTKSKVKRKFKDVSNLIEGNRVKNKDGSESRKTNWDVVADLAYNLYNITTQGGAKPTGQQFSDAYFNAAADMREKE